MPPDVAPPDVAPPDVAPPDVAPPRPALSRPPEPSQSTGGLLLGSSTHAVEEIVVAMPTTAVRKYRGYELVAGRG
jgi:hypothetical protein